MIIVSINFGRSALFSWGKLKQYTLPDTRVIVSEWLSVNLTLEDRILLEKSANYPVVDPDYAVYIDNWN